jgi:hypothetical protein
MLCHPAARAAAPAEHGDDDVRERIASTLYHSRLITAGSGADDDRGAWSAVGLHVPPRLSKRVAVKPPRPADRPVRRLRGEWRERKAA